MKSRYVCTHCGWSGAGAIVGRQGALCPRCPYMVTRISDEWAGINLSMKLVRFLLLTTLLAGVLALADRCHAAPADPLLNRRGPTSRPPDVVYLVPGGCDVPPVTDCIVEHWTALFRDGFESGDTTAWGGQWWLVRATTCPARRIRRWVPSHLKDYDLFDVDEVAEYCHRAAEGR